MSTNDRLDLGIGLARVLSPVGALPQAAERLNPALPLLAGETAVAVSSLNLDSASYAQLRSAYDGDGDRIREAVLQIICSRGKMHNPVTGSGGMLVGEVAQTTPGARADLQPGQRIATLVSLTATPLTIHDGLSRWDGLSEVVPTTATAILARRSLSAIIPEDLPSELALAVLDVCGAPALTLRVLSRSTIDGRTPRRLLILGGGKSATLCAAVARDLNVHTQMVVPGEEETNYLRSHGLADEVLTADARDAVGLRGLVLNSGPLADVTIVCVNVPGCENGALLVTVEGGAIVFFSMATQLSTAALSAEALGLDLDLYIGSGYVPGHAELALDLVRRHPEVREFFSSRA